MRMDKLTSKFQMALADAQSLAVGRDNQFIEPVHLMMALLDQQGGQRQDRTCKNDRHHTGVVHLERQVLGLSGHLLPAHHPLGILHGDAPLTEKPAIQYDSQPACFLFPGSSVGRAGDC